MKETLCCCLFLLILGQNFSAAIIHEVVEERMLVRLLCPHHVEGRVMWSRETRGTRTDVLTVDGDTVTRLIHDPYKYYDQEVDGSLLIRKVKPSDSGRYFCNDEEAVDLTVIPSGTARLHTERSSSISLTCPPDVGGSDFPTWSTDAGEIKQQERFEVFPENRSLIIRHVQPADSGLYYCDGKPAVYLSVTEDHQPDRGVTSEPTSTPTTARTTTTAATEQQPTTTVKDEETTTTKKPRKKPRKDKKSSTSKPTSKSTTARTTTTAATERQQTTAGTSTTTAATERQQTTVGTSTTTGATEQQPTTVKDEETTTKKKSRKKPRQDNEKILLYILPPIPVLIIAIIVTVICCRRRRLKKKGEEVGPVYCEIQDGLLLQEPTASASPEDHTYSTISEIPLVKKKTATAPPDESPYSLIEYASVGGNVKGVTESPYCLLEDTNAPANNNNLTSVV